MSWIDKIKNDLIITTGDGQRYVPSWINATLETPYNITEFEFPEVDGALVIKKRPKARRYSLEIYFQGDDHLDTATAFRVSADDSRPWSFEHPYYGILTVQTPSLLYDNSTANVTKITGTVIETILEDNPKVGTDPVDTVKVNKEALDETFVSALTETPSASDASTMANNNAVNYKLGVPAITIPEEYEEYTNAFNAANSAINNATAEPLLAMRLAIDAITYPARFSVSVSTRLNLLYDQLQTLRQQLGFITAVSSKQIFQNSAGSVLSSMALAAVTPLATDYKNSVTVFDTIELLLTAYNQYIEDLDGIQSDNGGAPTSFIPDADSLTQLSLLISTTMNALFVIALRARRERFIIAEKDTNLIILTHRLYGLDDADENLTELMDNNNIGLTQMLQIKKDTKIVYYI
jgi:hypothetical protein